ncbi:TPA: hypothetical protein EYP13_03985, partial [Candidatus Micrarchaeota archaeon]|nr:hypothetical protein [Candidatus Micrarchaeota archaeon]
MVQADRVDVMDFVFGEKFRHAKLRKNPELARNTGFWGEIKNPVAFVEKDVKTAVSAVKVALEAGVRHEKLRDVCRHVVGKMGADEALRALGVHRDRKTRRAVLDVLGHRIVTEVKDPDLRKAILEEVEDPERLLRVLAELNDEKVAREFLRKKKGEILSHDGALRELARNPTLLRIALEEEWHGEMSPAQLRRVGAALTSGGSFSPAEAFEIIANTLEKDIKSKEAARATAILLKDIVKSQDTTRIGQVERLMEKISEHVFRKDGTVDKKFGIELLHAAGPEFATAVLRLAKHLYEKGDYDGAAKKIWQALWLVKEAVKHHDRGIHGKHHRMFGEGGDVEEYVRKREAQLVRTFVQILSTPHLKEIDDTDPHHDQILRTLEYLGRRREVLGTA